MRETIKMTETIFGSYYKNHDEKTALTLPDQTDYLAGRNIFSHDNLGAQAFRARFAQRMEAGDAVYLLGFNALTHDSGLSLIRASESEGVQILANLEEERFNGKKHFAGYPEHCAGEMKRLLSRLGVSARDIFCVLYAFDMAAVEKDILTNALTRKKIITQEIRHLHHHAFISEMDAEGARLEQKNFSTLCPALVKAFQRLSGELELEEGTPLIQMPHHENHAAVSLAASPFSSPEYADETIMVSCIDGLGENMSCSLYKTQKGRPGLGPPG